MPEVKWIDLYRGQDLDTDQEDAINYEAAVFIAFGRRPWFDNGAGCQSANTTIAFHVVTYDLEATVQLQSTSSPANPVMRHIAMVDKLNQVMHSHYLSVIDQVDENSTEYVLSTDMQRSDQDGSFRTVGLIKDIVTFSTTIYDYTAGDWIGRMEKLLEAEVEGLISVQGQG